MEYGEVCIWMAAHQCELLREGTDEKSRAEKERDRINMNKRSQGLSALGKANTGPRNHSRSCQGGRRNGLRPQWSQQTRRKEKKQRANQPYWEGLKRAAVRLYSRERSVKRRHVYPVVWQTYTMQTGSNPSREFGVAHIKTASQWRFQRVLCVSGRWEFGFRRPLRPQ